MHFAIEDNDDFAMVGGKVAGRFFKRLGALGIQRDVDRIVRRRLAFLINRHARNVGTGHERRVGALGHFEVVALFARGEFVAGRVGHGFRVTYWPLSILVFTDSSVKESRRANSSLPVRPMVSSAASVSERPGICTRIWSVPCSENRCLARAERVHAALDDGARLLHVFAGNGIAEVLFAVSTTDKPP